MPPPIISRLNPSAGWPGGIASDGSTVQGTLVIIHGRHFHPTPEMHRNQISFASSSGGRVPAPVEWASVNEIDYQPDGIVARDSTTPGGLNAPRGVAVDSADNLYIADTENHRIVRISTSGSISSWGSHGSGNGQFDRPTGIDVDSNNFVYVADTMNHRIQKFDTNGNYITQWGSHGSGLGQFDGPMDVDVTILGGLTFVYVADSNNHRVVRTDGTGGMPANFLTPSGTGRVLGVCAPRGYGFVYATDPTNHRILRWAWFGIFNGTYGPSGDPHNLAVIDLSFPMGIEQDFDGYVYVVDQGDRVVKKFDSFDPNFRQIARFGLTIPTVPGPTPDDEFVDPVDIVVTDLKAAYIVDRQRKQVVRYTPTDSQEIWVHVPAGAASGPLGVRTDDGSATAPFSVFVTAGVEIVDAYMCQGLYEYPLVAGKKTIIRYQMRTVGATTFHNYHWGSPVTDSAVCRISRDGTNVGQVNGESVFITGTGGFMSSEIGFEILFKIPYWLINTEGDYRFEVAINRSGTHSFHDSRVFNGTFSNRKSYKIVSSPVTHLVSDGTRVSSGPMFPALFYIGGDPQHFLDWMDWSQLYSGYLNYNRLYPVRYSMGDISEYGIWVNGTMADGINSDDEVRDMLLVLELTRRRLNEDLGAGYDFMLGIVHRGEVNQNWWGVTSDSYRSALISLGNDSMGDPAYDVGSIIGHELLHQHGRDHQSARELALSDKEAWNSFYDNFVRDPVTLMYDAPSGTYRHYTWNDRTTFAEGRENGSTGNYDRLFDALANPHPKNFHMHEFVLGDKDRPRPEGTQRNFNLIGSLKKDGEFTRLSSWVGSGNTPVTPRAEGSKDRLVFLNSEGNEILSWPIHVSFGLRALKQDRTENRIDEVTALISLTVPFPEATARVEMVVDEKTAWSVDVPSQSPTIQLIRPRGGEKIGDTDILTVEWQASHSQNVELEYLIEYSFDGGKTFRPLVSGLKETRYEWQAGLTASTGNVRIRVVASDGFNQAFDVSDDIHVGDVVSRVVIVQPRPGEVIPEGKPIQLLAMAQNIEQGALQLNSSNTLWIIDDEIIVGNGNEIEFSEIELTTPRGIVTTPPAVGAHSLRVEVTVAQGKKISDKIPIEIVADSDRDGIPDDVERERGTNPNDPGDGANIAPIYPFGQWQFLCYRTKTIFQISHLGTGNLSLELGFFDEAGVSLSQHPIKVIENGSVHKTSTDSKGWVGLQLKSLQTVLIEIAATKKRRKGFGTCRVRVAKNSGITESSIQAHGWIYHRRIWWLFGWESQGTVIINNGEPMQIRGVKSWSAFSPKMLIPDTNYQLLGRCQMATQAMSRKLKENTQD